METCIQSDPQTSYPVPMSHGEINASFTAMIEDGIFNPVKRHVAGWWNEEDAFQDALCQLYRDYRSAALKGRPTDNAALVHGLRLGCFDLSRRFTSGKGRRRDVMGRQAQMLDGIECLRFDGLVVEVEDGPYSDAGVTREPPMSFVNELSLRQTADIEDRIHSAIDLDAWLSDLDPTDRSILQGRMEGRSGTEIGERIGKSMSYCYRRMRELGHQLAEEAGLTGCLEPQSGTA